MDQSAIKSEINTRTNFDSEFCGSIPLNFINLVQGHGVLIVLKKKTYKIIQISDNAPNILNLRVEQVINEKLRNYISTESFEEVKMRIEHLGLNEQVPFNIRFVIDGKDLILNSTLHHKHEYYILEVENERAIEGNSTFTHLHQQIKFIMVRLKEAHSMQELMKIAAEEIKSFSGFDRVMIYQFDKDWNGSVEAEAREEDMEPYLNLRFPASDIPKQARELYLKNSFRLIPDIHALSSRLFPVVNPVTHSFTDLSSCNLRSAPGVHLEYLKNMNVTASMSTPIIKHNNLWGLISCHHKTAKFPSYEMISCFELLAGIISSQITSRESETISSIKSKNLEINTKIIEKLYKEESLKESVIGIAQDILRLLNLGGVAYTDQQEIITEGETPDHASIEKLVKWLDRRVMDKIFTSSNLLVIYPESKTFSEYASGIIVLPLHTLKSNYIIGFRPEVIFTVDWGGNPYEAIQLEPDAKTYHPRNSFSMWKQVVSKTSEEWTQQDIEAAEFLRTSLLQKLVYAEKN